MTEVPEAKVVDGSFKSADQLIWMDISDEAWREYVYRDGSCYRVENPLHLNVKQKATGDSHRVITNTLSHYIVPGWIAIRWEVLPGKEPFAF